MIQTAILGYGNIGSGVAQVLLEQKDVIAAKVGEPVELRYILDLRDFPGDPLENRVVHDVNTILEDPEVQIVVETMGGTRPAYDFVKKALQAGKHVATSNKELVAAHGTELLQIAAEKKVNFLFEASVGGAIPIIRPLNCCITADRIRRISGILNGTTNFMLTSMKEEGKDFHAVLKEAQDLGYAEQNPEADVEGKDACRKIAILSSMAYGRAVSYEDIATEGITRVTPEDMKYAEELGYSLKLIASASMEKDGVQASVAPRMISRENPLSAVNGVLNAVLVEGEMSGPLMFYGPGAGKLPTATAVAADVVEAAQHLNRTVLKGWTDEPITIQDQNKVCSAFYLRLSGTYEQRSAELADLDIQRTAAGTAEDEFAVVTGKLPEEVFYQKTAVMAGVLGTCRVE